MMKNEVEKAVELAGGFSATARLLGVTPKAVRNWVEAGRLPRTEATGETEYAATMAQANPKIDKEILLATAIRKKKKIRRVNLMGRPSFR